MNLRSIFHVSSISVINLAGTTVSFFVSVMAAVYFGLSEELDCYYASITIPAILLTLIGVDYFGTNFFPIYSRVRSEKGEESANNLTNSVINSLLVVVLLVGVILLVFAKYIHKAFLPGMSVEMLNKTVGLFRLAFPAVILQVPITFMSYIMQYEKKIIYSQAYILINAFTMFIMLVCLRSILGVKSLVVGSLVGAFFSLLFMVYLSKGYKFKPKIFVKDESFRKVLSTSIVMSGSGMIGRLTSFIERYFASFFPAGAISSIGLAGKITMTLTSLVTTPLNTVMYVKMTEADSKKDDELCINIWQRYINFAFWIMIPLGFLVIFFGKDIVSLVFQRKNFSAEMVHSLSIALGGYAGVLVFGGVGGMITRLYYLKNKVLIPAIMNFLSPIIYFVLIALLTKVCGFSGIPIGISIWYIVSGVLLIVFVNKIMYYFSVKKIFFTIFIVIMLSTLGLYGGFVTLKLTGFSGHLLRLSFFCVGFIVTYVLLSLLAWFFIKVKYK